MSKNRIISETLRALIKSDSFFVIIETLKSAFDKEIETQFDLRDRLDEEDNSELKLSLEHDIKSSCEMCVAIDFLKTQYISRIR